MSGKQFSAAGAAASAKPEGQGGKANLDERFSLIYDELRRVASAVWRTSPNPTLNPTALVNEAYLKLVASENFPATSPLHFRRIAVQAMRQLLCDAARARLAAKRGGENTVRVPLHYDLEQKVLSLEHLVVLNDLLDNLHKLNPGRQQWSNTVSSRVYWKKRSQPS